MASKPNDQLEVVVSEPDERGLYPIRTVASLTGINPVTLRAWERRYGLIRPQRTPKGHRLYTQADIDRVRRILELLDQGIPIGQTRRLLDAPSTATSESAGDPWEDYRQRTSQAISQFDLGGLESAYNDALSLYPLELVTQRLVLPLLEDLRQRRSTVAEGPAELAFFRSYMRNKLGARFHQQASQSRGLKILAAGLPAEDCEIELMLFVLAALNQGYRVVPLGGVTPLADLGAAAARASARALVVYCATSASLEAEDGELASLVRSCPVPVLVAGAAVRRSQETVRAAGAMPLAADTAQAVALIRSVLAPRG